MVGVFDSGIGGITTLCSLLERGGDFVYLRDNVRYGDKSDKFITARTLSACAALKKVGVDTIVIACNTATAVAIERLRELDGAVKYIGTEPAVKPALKSCKFVTVALTKAAAEQRRFRSLISGHESRIKVAAFDRLAEDIEKANFEKRTMIKSQSNCLMRSAETDLFWVALTTFFKTIYRNAIAFFKTFRRKRRRCKTIAAKK